MRSLRTRLLTGTIIGVVLLLALFSLVVYTVIRSALVKEFDASLASIAHLLAASVELDGDTLEVEFEVRQMPEFHDSQHPTYYELWKANGAVAARSPLLGTKDLTHSEGPLDVLVFPAPQERNGRPVREAGLTFLPRNVEGEDDDAPPPASQQPLTLAVARDAGNLYGQLQFLRRLLLIVSMAVTLLSLLIIAVIVRRGLHPLNAMAAEIARITEDNLATRIGGARVPTEVVPIRDRLNELMARLEASFSRERQFNADVAHELRTPLAGIRSTIEVTLARDRPAPEYRQALSDCLEITNTMQSMVGDLLTLAGLNARNTRFQTKPVKVAEVIDSCWGSRSAQAHQRGLAFKNRVDAESTLVTDRQSLVIVLSNVLGNAVEYADTGGQIEATARRTADALEVCISNTGCQLTAEQVSRVFDSFWRADSSRSAAGVHCGLGLALVRRLVRALGGDVTAELQPKGIFTLRLRLPLKP